MRVAQIIDNLRVGGAQSLLVTLQETLPPGAVELDFLVLSAGQEMVEPSLRRQLEERGARIFTFPGKNLPDQGRFRRLLRHLRTTSYDLVHTHLTYANILGGSAGRLAGRPVIATLHNVRPSHQSRLHLTLEGKALQWAACRIVAVGERVAAASRERWPALDIDVVPNAITMPSPTDWQTRQQLRQRLAGGTDGPLLLAVGRLTAQKGYPDLLAAFARVRQQEPAAVLLIAGAGDARPALETRLAELGLEGNVRLLGLRDDVPALLSAADLFVSASHWEGMPVAVLEAMGAGLPVVATNVGDVSQVVTEGTGILVPAQEPERLADAIGALLADEDRRRAFGQAGRARVNEHFSARTWTERVLSLYREVAEEN